VGRNTTESAFVTGKTREHSLSYTEVGDICLLPDFSNLIILGGDKGHFLAVCSAFVTAVLAYLGCEIVGVTVGEAKSPRRAIPRAISLTLWRIVVFYVLLVLL